MASGTADRIAAEASAILRAEGADAVSMRRVASAVGITPMAIYRHFPNREALLRAVAARGWATFAGPHPEQPSRPCQRHVDPRGPHQPRGDNRPPATGRPPALGRARANDQPAGDDPRHELRAALDALLDFALTQPKLYALLSSQAEAGLSNGAPDFRRGDSPLLARVLPAVDEAMHRGWLEPDDVDEVALSLVALTHGLVSLHQAGWLGLSDEQFRQLCRSALGRLLRGIGG
jgi:AcrR family transcriptional regulator